MSITWYACCDVMKQGHTINIEHFQRGFDWQDYIIFYKIMRGNARH